MNSFKNHLSLIFALVALIASLQFFMSFSVMVQNYEESIGNDYAIVIVSKKPIELQSLIKIVPSASTLELIDPEFIVNEVRSAISEKSVQDLKANLPIFYKLKLNKYPSIQDRENIEKSVSNLDGVIKIESFAKTQNKIYKLLLLSKTIILVFAGLMFVIAFLLIVRQMEVWRYEHSDRINIMSIFGAPLWIRSAVLYRLAIIDSFISTAIVVGLFYYISADLLVNNSLREIGIPSVEFAVVKNGLILLGVALVISLGSVTYVIKKAQETDE